MAESGLLGYQEDRVARACLPHLRSAQAGARHSHTHASDDAERQNMRRMLELLAEAEAALVCCVDELRIGRNPDWAPYGSLPLEEVQEASDLADYGIVANLESQAIRTNLLHVHALLEAAIAGTVPIWKQQ